MALLPGGKKEGFKFYKDTHTQTVQVFENTELNAPCLFSFPQRSTTLPVIPCLYLSLTHAHHFRSFMLFMRGSALSLLFALFDVQWKQKPCN